MSTVALQRSLTGRGGAGAGAGAGGGGSPSASGASGSGTSLGEAILRELVPQLVGGLVGVAMLYWTASKMSDIMDPNRKSHAVAASVKSRLQAKTGRNLKDVTLDKYELMLAEDVIDPRSIEETFDMIGGIDAIKREILDLVVQPLTHPELFAQLLTSNDLVSLPRGVLLYGQPGTGKTMLAKAIAKSSGATFLNLQASTILNKWFGETQKLVSAAFSLAAKLSPSIIFIDEVDSVLGQRSEGEQMHVLSMKSEFMTLMDGLLTNPQVQVMVLAATNRPMMLDPAIQRRLPRTFEIGLPGPQERVQILKVILKNTRLAGDVSLSNVAERTEGFSGSDLKELSRTAMKPAAADFKRDFFEGVARVQAQAQVADDQFYDASSGPPAGAERQAGAQLRPLCMADFNYALARVGATGRHAEAYRQREHARQLHVQRQAQSNRPLSQAQQEQLAMAQFLADFFQQQQQQQQHS
jgi:SpoVK/Ycf46/Vps4 family AAA+-type ATPase